ncbi:MAG: acyltransferase family protein [Microgenomates group bacterium]
MKRMISLDDLRVLGALLVVAVHADNITISPSNYLGGISWWFASSMNTFGRIAVPLFIMISGALIYRSSHAANFLDLLKRSWRRIILPGFFWITLYFIWQNIWYGGGLNFAYIFDQLYHSSFGYLHYLFIILGLYLSTPILQRIPLAHRSKVAWGSMAFMVVFEYIRYRGVGWGWTGDTPWLWISYIPYYLLGSVLLETKLSKVTSSLLAVFGTISLAGAIISTYYANLGTISGNTVWWMFHGASYFWGHFSLTDCLVTIAIYYFGTSIFKHGIKPKLDHWITNIGSTTYGIYLAHVMVMDAIDYYGHFGIDQISHDLWLYYILRIFLIFFVSYLLVILIRLLRLQKPLLGEV